MTGATFGWSDIARLGLVQAALGSIVVLTTSTMNRVMVVELALPAVLPGALVGLHYAIQLLRPYWGHGSDGGRRRTPWIIGGMAALGLGAIGAATSIVVMGANPVAGIALAIFAFALIGMGVGAAGTCLLALLASRVGSDKRAGAAATVWLMMIAGIVFTAVIAGQNLDPYTPARLVAVTASVAGAAFLLTLLALFRLEQRTPARQRSEPIESEVRDGHSFWSAFQQAWSEPGARRFTIFVFVSMVAYSAQDLILEPFAGSIFGFSPGESTQLTGLQHGGVFAGMLLVGILGSASSRLRFGNMRQWAVGGCVASAVALCGLAMAAFGGPSLPLRPTVFLLGVANGAFAVAAIGTMMELATAGRKRSEGVRMGLWGAAQGVAFGLGGFLGTVGVDVLRAFSAAPEIAYGSVFAAEAMLFLVAANLAAGVTRPARDRDRAKVAEAGTRMLHAARG
jgi:MFS transporter, BCD family, chlorophyll transporter